MESLFLLLDKTRSWFNTGTKEPSLTSKQAYVMSITGNNKYTMEKLEKEFNKDLFYTIECNAKVEHTECIIRFPKWMTDAQKESINNNLLELGYKILYKEKSFILISWSNEQ